MFIQGGMWIVGTIVIFLLLAGVVKLMTVMFFPKTAREQAETKLQDKIEGLELLKLDLETAKLESSIESEKLKLEKKILKTNGDIETMKEKLTKLKGGSDGN